MYDIIEIDDTVAMHDLICTGCYVTLRDLEVMADIGVYGHEVGILQPLLISVTLTVVEPAGDEIGQTFDYTEIRRHARNLARMRTVLVETFARRLGELCLAQPQVMVADVRIDKPRALSDSVAGARVILRRSHSKTVCN